ncbi:MAG: DNA photolyase [Desulfobacteraceae bacterium]|nr:MAG: DNA photolyase [Desulfobacteraceae bacterium]
MKNSIKKIVVDPETFNRTAANRMIERSAHSSLIKRPGRSLNGAEVLSLESEKQTLWLCDFPGEILKPCPGTHNYICCGYQILQIGMNCPLDCSYCILQAYLNTPGLRVFVNVPDRINEVTEQIEQNPEKIFRIGTGEFTDSLALDSITEFSQALAPVIAGHKNAIIELKTKTNQIEKVLQLSNPERIILSWSVNSPVITAQEEHGAPSLKNRLKAAQQCQRQGFMIGLHFDPLIEHPGWQDQYRKAVEMLNQYLDPKKIIWISMGCLRYMPGLKAIIRKRHPGTHILDGEFIMGLDGKMRYFKPIRIEMYAYMKTLLDQWYPDLGLYLCMESDEIWQKAMGWSPQDSPALAEYLDNRVRKFYEA